MTSFFLHKCHAKSGVLDNWSVQLRSHNKEVLSKAERDHLSGKKKDFYLVQYENK